MKSMGNNKFGYEVSKISDTEYVLSNAITGDSIRIEDVPIYHNLIPKSPFLSGIGSAMNIPGNYFSFSKSILENNDSKAMASDWKAVGLSFLDAFSKFSIDKKDK